MELDSQFLDFGLSCQELLLLIVPLLGLDYFLEVLPLFQPLLLLITFQLSVNFFVGFAQAEFDLDVLGVEDSCFFTSCDELDGCDLN